MFREWRKGGVSGEGALVTLEGKGFGDIVVSVSKICEWVLERAQPEVITAERVARPSLGDVRASMPQGRRNQGAGLPQQRAFDIMHQVQFSSVAQSCLTLWPHESQHARPPCPSPTPRAHPNSCPSSWWCHPAISSSVVPFSSCPQSLPATGSFPMSQLFTWGGQSIGVSALTSVVFLLFYYYWKIQVITCSHHCL